jgi:signal transduction histidine kinase/ActR/RegA family two-component response regulator/HAMP domain-containing protein
MRLRLRTLLLGLTGLAILGVTLGELALTFNERRRAAETRLLAETRRLMAAERPLLLNALVVGDLATAEQTLRQINADVVWRRVILYEPDGRRPMLDASPASLPDSNAPALLRRLLAFDPAEERTPIAADPVVYAVLAVTPASHRLESEVWAEIRADILMQAVLLAVVLLIISVIMGRALRPVHDLADSAARFGAGDLTARMPRTRLVEIAPTVEAFNTMADNLQRREAERQESERRQAARFAVTRVLADAGEPDETLARVVETLGDTLGWARGECWRLDPDTDVMRRVCAWQARGLPAVAPEAAPPLARGVGVAGRAWATGRAEWSMSGGSALAMPLRGTGGLLGLVTLSAAAREVDDELLAALTDVGGRIGLFLERKQAEETLRRTEDQLRQAMKMDAIGKLAGGVAHDFNNLLTVILGRCSVLLPSIPESTATHRALTLIYQTAQRAAALTRQLLAFSRKQVLQPQPVDLTAVVDGITPMLRRLIGEHVELVTRLAPAPRRVRADLSQLEQVIVNLAINARDAMPQGGRLSLETAEVVLDAAYARRHEGARVGPHVQLTVSDTGVGMDADTLPRIFEPFFTTKGPGQGTGLGLSTVYGIVQQSGGSVGVESEPGRGTTFRVCLPVLDEPAVVPLAEPPPAPMARGWETVLVVEDERDVRELARDVLLDAGYTVLEAADAERALKAAQAHPGAIHLLLTDVVMPGASGRDLADRLSPLRPTMKVVYMSGYTDHAIVHQGVLDPGLTYIDKPFMPDDLARVVRAVLDDEKPEAGR